MSRTCFVAPLTTIVLLLATTASRAHAETESPPMTAESVSGVTVGLSGAVAAFTTEAASRLAVDPAPGLHAHGGYRFRNGLSPDLALLYTRPVASLSQGLRWWLPLDGHLRPWIGAHAGLAHVTFESGDTTTGQTYFSVDGGIGLDFMVTRSVGFGIGGDWTYANALDAPRAQPVPAGGSVPARESYVLDWFTMRAGIGVVL